MKIKYLFISFIVIISCKKKPEMVGKWRYVTQESYVFKNNQMIDSLTKVRNLYKEREIFLKIDENLNVETFVNGKKELTIGKYLLKGDSVYVNRKAGKVSFKLDTMIVIAEANEAGYLIRLKSKFLRIR